MTCARYMRAAEQPEIEIRPCLEADLDAIVSIERDTFPLPWTRDQFADLLSHPAGVGWVASLAGGEIAGYAIGWVAADEAELADLAVTEALRDRGLGAELVRAFAREAGVRGARRLYLEVRVSNEGARRFYHRFGFEILSRRAGYYRNPVEDGWTMGVDLPLG